GRAGHRRCYRPWVPEPGMWFQWDYGDGPQVGPLATSLFCAWLAWSRFRVVIPILDKTLPTVIASIDTSLRRFGGVPTYALTDNEKGVPTFGRRRNPLQNRNFRVVSVRRRGYRTAGSCSFGSISW